MSLIVLVSRTPPVVAIVVVALGIQGENKNVIGCVNLANKRISTKNPCLTHPGWLSTAADDFREEDAALTELLESSPGTCERMLKILARKTSSAATKSSIMEKWAPFPPFCCWVQPNLTK